MITKQVEVRNKAAEFMTEIGHDILSDYEVTIGVAVRIAEWSNKKLIDEACGWLKSHIQGRDIDYILDDFRHAMEGHIIIQGK